MEVVSYNTQKIDNYPFNSRQLEEDYNKWVETDYTGFKIGDKVQFLYTLNRDGNTSEQIYLYEKMKNERPIGIVKGFEVRKPKINIYGNECKFLNVEFEDSKLYSRFNSYAICKN